MSDSLRQAFKDRDYRHGYVDEFLNASIATQIKVLREQRGWTQKELAKRAHMRQPRISVMENVNYSSWSIKILRELAEAFDLTLRVSFESFTTRLNDIDQFGRASLERPSFDEDHYVQEVQQIYNTVFTQLELPFASYYGEQGIVNYLNTLNPSQTVIPLRIRQEPNPIQKAAMGASQ